jgi:hypothetical protein
MHYIFTAQARDSDNAVRKALLPLSCAHVEALGPRTDTGTIKGGSCWHIPGIYRIGKTAASFGWRSTVIKLRTVNRSPWRVPIFSSPAAAAPTVAAWSISFVPPDGPHRGERGDQLFVVLAGQIES